MKYKRGEFLYNIHFGGPNHTGWSSLVVLSYDEKRRKYKCLDIDDADLVGYRISFYNENDLRFLKDFDINHNKTLEKYKDVFLNIDDKNYNWYDCDGLNEILIRSKIRG